MARHTDSKRTATAKATAQLRRQQRRQKYAHTPPASF